MLNCRTSKMQHEIRASALLAKISNKYITVFIDYYWVSFPGREATTRSQLESTASEEPTVMNGPMFFSVLPVRTVILKRCAVSYCLWTEDYQKKTNTLCLKNRSVPYNVLKHSNKKTLSTDIVFGFLFKNLRKQDLFLYCCDIENKLLTIWIHEISNKSVWYVVQ